MRIGVMGAGSIGGYFGGMLARNGHQVTLVARGAHLQAIRRDGLQIVRDDEQFTLRCPADIDATDDPIQAGPVDLLLLTVKTYHNEQAVLAMLPMVGPDTVVLCLQNGIDSYRAAEHQVGRARILPGAAYIEAGLPKPGVVTQRGRVVRIVFGELDGIESKRGVQIREALERVGIPALFTRNIQQTLWTKFLFIATMAGVTTLARETLAELLVREEWRQVVLGCMGEIETVGRASGVSLEPRIVDETIEYMEANLEQMHASMHSDIMAGRPLELEALNGAVVRAGRDAGVATPINDVIYAMLKPYAPGTG
ncbi:MAG: 2-dehydropantoate 2-reductase [SAR202 cluster bacterium Io17-Chloro-G9]|nr:MAG: 2-dehydropantoate 2-reductase [SAR202 cluster bacterium Io17-Chloro-G9]